ncbi:hypothetical protein HPP92_022951 [Vanilla planifolia]|uniref:Uncharacterized protein n=1 Tax=Vanilla planifolia TaxID=51239 RepID=A0A835PVP4_VANPL|nr:hypothetical protein HPP92_022951 [Vanilla planifolia]
MGFALEVASKVKRIFFSKPAKEKASNGANTFGEPGFGDKIANPGLRSGVTDFGSKDEMFFDTRVWLDSDCDDDFYSVNGDFTPSRGSTPNHPLSFLGTPQRNGRALYDDMFSDTKSEPSPTDKKKKLAELLQVSLIEQADSELHSQNNNAEAVAKSASMMNGKTGVFEETLDQSHQSLCEGTVKTKKERTGMASACCMPNLVPGITSRKQKMNPVN